MILGIETATPHGSLALLDGEQVIAERALDAERHRHAATLLATLDEVLAELGRALDEVDGIAVSIGPGSFTGLRIGLATALGLCFGSERWIVPVPTLAALALQAGRHERVAALLDARRGQVYAGLYGPGGRALEEDAVTEPLAWLAEREKAGPLVALGPGVEAYRAEIEARGGSTITLLAPEAGAPRAASVAAWGARGHREGRAAKPADVQLAYLRSSDARPLDTSGGAS